MQIYLPLAEVSFNIFYLIGLGIAVGLLSGTLGVGGGFIMTPILIALGFPPQVAVSSQASQITGTSVSAGITYWNRKQVDLQMALIMGCGGIIGVLVGTYIFRYFLINGQIDFIIRMMYAVFLCSIGVIMINESFRAFRLKWKNKVMPRKKVHSHSWFHKLPLRIKFRRSNLYISSITPFTLGVFVGLLTSIMGVGGGFILIPAMVYILRMSTIVAIGTSLIQVILITIVATILHSGVNHTVDIVLAGILMVGGVIGAHFGAKYAVRFRVDALRALLAILVFITGIYMMMQLILTPENVYSLVFLKNF